MDRDELREAGNSRARAKLEGILDQVAAAVPVRVVADGAFVVSPSGNDGTAPALRSERRSRSASEPLSARG